MEKARDGVERCKEAEKEREMGEKERCKRMGEIKRSGIKERREREKEKQNFLPSCLP